MRDERFSHQTYLSPFTWRYGSDAMRGVWSQLHQRRLWRRVWAALAEAQAALGLVSQAQADDLQQHADEVDLARSEAIERTIHHDLMAELRVFAAQCPVGGGIIHLGATSADIQDNADAVRLIEALDLIIERLRHLLLTVAGQIEEWANTVSMGFTHIQPAEPTTIGYRIAQYGQDFLTDWFELTRVRAQVRGKGLKGAVGTAASYAALLDDTPWTPADLEERVMTRLGLTAYPVTTQVAPRKQDWLVLNVLAGIAGSVSKVMFDLRILQSPPFGEWAEPFRAGQVGSSAMPFKRNPITAEKINSLARWVAGLPRLAWDNAALSLLERTLDDSANRRALLPEAFLAVDEVLGAAQRVLQDLHIDEVAIARNLEQYGLFAGVERVLMTLGKAGADRQVMHERLREHSMAAWAAVTRGGDNPLCDLLCADPEITRYITSQKIGEALDVVRYVGDAPERAQKLAANIRLALEASIA